MQLVFELHTYWHIGSGRGQAAVADAIIARDVSGLPFIPGRTVKGLLRSAADLVAHAGRGIDRDQVQAWFGTGMPVLTEDAAEAELESERRFSTREGQLYFGSAQLSSAWRGWAPANAGAPELQELTTRLAATKIDANGVAADHTLRVMEVAVPMVLRASIDGPPESASGWRAGLRLACPLVRAIGADRNRGLGRVTVRLEEAS